MVVPVIVDYTRQVGNFTTNVNVCPDCGRQGQASILLARHWQGCCPVHHVSGHWYNYCPDCEITWHWE